MAAGSRERSPWVYVGCGCAALVILVGIAVAVAGFLGFRGAKDWVETLNDPASRDQRAREMLGAEQLPMGYHALMFMSLPLDIMSMVILTDGEVPDEVFGSHDVDDLGQNSLFYIRVRADAGDRKELRDYLSGESDRANVLEHVETDFDFDMADVISRGSFQQGDMDLLYAVSRGEVRRSGQRTEGLITMFSAECPGDKRIRLGYWMQKQEPGAAESSSAASGGLGTAASEEAVAATASEVAAAELVPDEGALRELIGHFDLCVGE